MAESNHTNTTQSLIDFTRETHKPHTVKLPSLLEANPEILLAPAGMVVHDLTPYMDQFRVTPLRMRGTMQAADLDSFVALTNRHKDSGSAIFAMPSIDKPTLTAVLNHNSPGSMDEDARFGDHRVLYQFPLSIEWQHWKKLNGQAIGQGDFARFIEDRVADVLYPTEDLLGTISDAATGGDFGQRTPNEELAYLVKLYGGEMATPNRLIELSRGLSVNEGAQVKEFRNLQTGEVQIQLVTEHTDDQGQKLKVPNWFLIGIPIFANGPLYKIAIRLRYRLPGGKITWAYEMYRVEKVFDFAFREACGAAAEKTGLPLYRGAAT